MLQVWKTTSGSRFCVRFCYESTRLFMLANVVRSWMMFCVHCCCLVLFFFVVVFIINLWMSWMGACVLTWREQVTVFTWARWPLRECSLRAKRLCCRATTRGWKMTSGPSWTTSQKSSKQQRYKRCCPFTCVVCLFPFMEMHHSHFLSSLVVSLPSKHSSRIERVCLIFSHCFSFSDRGWDSGFQSNPSRAGPLWDARQSSQHCEYCPVFQNIQHTQLS